MFHKKSQITLITLGLIAFNTTPVFAKGNSNPTNRGLATTIANYSQPQQSTLSPKTHKRVHQKLRTEKLLKPEEVWVVNTRAIRDAISTKCVRSMKPSSNNSSYPTSC